MPSERDSFWGRIKNPHGASGLIGLFLASLGLDWIEGLQCDVAQKAPRFFVLCKIHTLTGKRYLSCHASSVLDSTHRAELVIIVVVARTLRPLSETPSSLAYFSVF